MFFYVFYELIFTIVWFDIIKKSTKIIQNYWLRKIITKKNIKTKKIILYFLTYLFLDYFTATYNTNSHKLINELSKLNLLITFKCLSFYFCNLNNYFFYYFDFGEKFLNSYFFLVFDFYFISTSIWEFFISWYYLFYWL